MVVCSSSSSDYGIHMLNMKGESIDIIRIKYTIV